MGKFKAHLLQAGEATTVEQFGFEPIKQAVGCHALAVGRIGGVRHERPRLLGPQAVRHEHTPDAPTPYRSMKRQRLTVSRG